MSVCVNFNNENFKKLEAIYGTALADSFVRIYSKQAKRLEGDYYYPTPKEFKNWLISEKKDMFKVVDYSLSVNPSLSKRAILGLLRGIVNTYQGTTFVTKGFTTGGSLVIKEEQLETVFKPNLRVMVDLAAKHPNVFKIKTTKNSTTKIVEINAPKGMASEISGYMPDTKITEKYFSTGTTQKSSTILSKIAASSHPLNKVAQKLMEYVAVNDVDIDLLDETSIETLSTAGDIIDSSGVYFPDENKIKIAKNTVVRNGLSETLLLHEILHALSYRALRKNISESRDFAVLYKRAMEKFGKYSPTTKEGYYALYTEDEFFVALFTDAKFIKVLQEIPPVDNVKYTNLFEEIMNHLLKVLGITQENDNLYRQAFSVATSILDYQKEYLKYQEETMDIEEPPPVELEISEQPPSMFQLGGTEGSKASPKTMKLIKDFLSGMGVSFEEVKELVIDGKKVDANAVARITQALIQVVEGKTDVALAEEAMHFAVEIIQQKDPKLFAKLLKEINDYDILNQVYTDYGTNPLYQKDGKPDVLKLKKEAIGKVLAETVIKKSERFTEKPELLSKTRSWWQTILDFIKGLITKSGFDQAAMKVVSGEKIGSVADIRAEENELYLSENNRDVLYNRLRDMKNRISKDEDNPDESKRGYYINGIKIPRRVSDLVSDWYSRRFRDKELTKSDFQTAVDELKQEKGTGGHKDLEYAFSLFVDDDGFLRPTPLNDDSHTSFLNEGDRKMYEILRDNLKERLYSFPKGTRFLSEIIIHDPKRGIAGTIDFLAITEDGKVHILDWKFMDLNIDKYKDVPWYKINSWRIQMSQYKYILQNAYGVPVKDFGQTRMVPIKAFYSKGNAKENVLPRLLEIKIGAVNPQDIEDDYLIPVGLEKETTGDTKIDDLLEKLNGLYEKLSDIKVTPLEKSAKAADLNALFSAIRQLQMKNNVKPLVYQAKALNEAIKRLAKNYENNWKSGKVEDKDDAAVNDFYKSFETIDQSARGIYFTLDTDLSFLFEGKELSEEDEALKDELTKVSYDTRIQLKKLEEVEKDFVEKYIAGREKVSNIFSPEKVVKGASRLFGTTSTIQTKAISVLFKKANRTLAYAGMDANTETRRLITLEEEYKKLATAKGFTEKNYFSLIKKSNKNELIDEYEKEFYTELRKAIQDKDYTWIRNNVDKDILEKELKEQLERELERIKDKPTFSEEDEKTKEYEIKEAKRLYSIDEVDSLGWLLYDFVKKAPLKDKWETKEWKELHKKNAKGEFEYKAAVDFYNYIIERNKYFESIGYIDAKQARVFLPFVRKSFIEKVITGGKITIGEEFLRAVSIDEGDIGYGKKDPITGNPIDTVPIYLTSEVEGELSEDLFKTMALYNELAIKYKYLKDIEYQGRALLNVERNKKSIATSMFNKTIKEETGEFRYDPRNDENAELLEKMMKAIIYQQKYIQSESFDQLLGKLGNFGKKLNDKLGVKVFPEELSDRQMSINKTLDQLNNVFQMNALGFNPVSAISNYFGGTFQSSINAGTYFTKTEHAAEVFKVLTDKMTSMKSDERKKYFAALEYFLPLTENFNRELSKKLSVNKLSQDSVQDFVMILMRNSDWAVQTTNFFTYLRNTIVVDDEVFNTRQYVRSLPEFQNMYEGTDADRKERMKKFEEEVTRLNEEKGLLKIATISPEGQLVIPGVDRKSDSVIELRRKVQSINKDALGNLSEDDLRIINLNIYGKSFMIFKNWIPRPVDVRMGNLKYNSGSDAYEWGRMRMVFRMFSWRLWESMTNLKNALEANEKGVEYMRKLWEQKRQEYKDDTGKELHMTESQFMDLVRHNIKAQIIDAVYLITLFALVAGLKAYAPDEEEEEDEAVRNYYKFITRAADKVRDELLYFYDPTSLIKTIGSNIFPSLSYVTNFMKIFSKFMTEMYAISVGDEKLEKDTKVIKYVMRSFPVVNQAAGMLPMFYPELAKELGIRATSESRPIGL
jgi:hypothetical protein